MRRLFVGFFTSLILFSIEASGSQYEQVAYFCADCTNTTAAQQQALQYRPAYACDYGSPPQLPPISCQTAVRRVILINHLTRQQYAFLVTVTSHLDIDIVPDMLSTDELLYIDRAIDLREDWAAMNLDQVVEDGQVSAGAAGMIKIRPQKSTRSDCPVGTALDHVLQPSLQSPLKDAISLTVMNHLSDYAGAGPRVRRLSGIGLSLRGVGFDIQWENPEQDWFLANFGFPESEVSSPLNDFLSFEVELRGELNGQPILEIEFQPESSRAAGAIVDDLMNGRATVQNQCVMEKLEQFEQQNSNIEFRVGDPSGARFDFSTGGGGGTSNLCTKLLCATVCVNDICSCQFEVEVLVMC